MRGRCDYFHIVVASGVTEICQEEREGMSASGFHDTQSVDFKVCGLSEDPGTVFKPFVCLLFMLDPGIRYPH